MPGAEGVFDRVQADILATWTATPIAWPNKHFDAPERTGDAANPAAFLTAELEFRGADQAGFGNGAETHWRGEIVHGLWYELDCGIGLPMRHIDQLETLYRSAGTATVVFGRGRPERIGVQAEVRGVWYVWVLRIPFTAIKEI